MNIKWFVKCSSNSIIIIIIIIILVFYYSHTLLKTAFVSERLYSNFIGTLTRNFKFLKVTVGLTSWKSLGRKLSPVTLRGYSGTIVWDGAGICTPRWFLGAFMMQSFSIKNRFYSRLRLSKKFASGFVSLVWPEMSCLYSRI